MTNRILAYLAIASALLMSCSSNDELEKVEDIKQNHDPIRFRNINDSYQVTRTDQSIPNLLRQNFMVSCYKNFGTTNQQTVMPMYEVNFEDYTSVYGQVSWNYISSESDHLFYQEQFERYWDFSAFPYRFFAVSPAPVQNGTLTTGFNLTDSQLSIPMSFEYQTCTDGKTSPGAEPCLIAEVERNANGYDFDLLDKEENGNYPKEINKTSQTLNRIVALPFHHLNCKIRFCIYCPNLGEGGEEHEVTNVKIKASSSSFVTSATYNAQMGPNTTIMNGSFTDPRYDGNTLLTINDGANQSGHNLYYNESGNEEMVKYYFECPNGLMQIPQDGVQLSITFTVQGKFDETTYDSSSDNIEYDGGFTTFKDIPIVLKDTGQDTYKWEKNTYYTYNIILGPFIPAESTYPVGGDGTGPIWFTCVLDEWEDIESDVIDSGQESW